MDTHSEEWRRICEARHWLRQLAPAWDALEAKVKEIELARKAPQPELRAELKRQWQGRGGWWNDGA